MEPLRKIVWQFLKRLNIELPHDPAIPLLGIYAREMKTCPHKICTRVVIVVLLTIAKKWKQPKCPSTDECLHKMWHHPYDEILFCNKKERSTNICNNMEES